MDKLFLISYDLRHINKDYSKLYDAIKSEGDWQHPLESTWMVKTDNSVLANTIYEHLRPCIDENDSLFIVEITAQDSQGWLAKSFWEWLK